MFFLGKRSMWNLRWVFDSQLLKRTLKPIHRRWPLPWTHKYQRLRVTLDSVCLSGFAPSDLMLLISEVHTQLYYTHMHTQPGVLGTSQSVCPAVEFCAWSRLILCVLRPVKSSDSGDNRLPIYSQDWTSQDAHFINNNKAPLDRAEILRSGTWDPLVLQLWSNTWISW